MHTDFAVVGFNLLTYLDFLVPECGVESLIVLGTVVIQDLGSGV